MRWALTIIILIVLHESSEFQIGILLIISVLFQAFLLFGHPWQDELEHWLSLFNEVMVSLYLYLLLTLTDYNYMPFREFVGWSLLGVVFLSIIVNFLKFFFLIGRELWRHCRRKKLEKLREERRIAAEKRQALLLVK